MMASADFGRRQVLASSAISASLAAPRSGTAVTAAFSSGAPSASTARPVTALRPAFGVSRIMTRTPRGPATKSGPAMPA